MQSDNVVVTIWILSSKLNVGKCWRYLL